MNPSIRSTKWRVCRLRWSATWRRNDATHSMWATSMHTSLIIRLRFYSKRIEIIKWSFSGEIENSRSAEIIQSFRFCEPKRTAKIRVQIAGKRRIWYGDVIIWAQINEDFRISYSLIVRLWVVLLCRQSFFPSARPRIRCSQGLSILRRSGRTGRGYGNASSQWGKDLEIIYISSN